MGGGCRFSTLVGNDILVLPSPLRFSTLTFIVKAVDSVDAGTFVISSEQEEILWIFDLVGKQQTDSFQRLFSSVDVISQKQVVTLGRETSVFEQPQQVVVLPVDVS